MEVRLCVCCCLPITLEERIKLETKVFPGSAGSSLLNSTLNIYFILKKMLKFPEKKCLRILQLFTQSEEGSSSISSSSSSSSVNRFQMCGKCEWIVNRAIECHSQILSLKREIDVLGDTLSNIINGCQGQEHLNDAGEVDDRNRKFFDGIRRLICTVAPIPIEIDRSLVKVEVEPDSIYNPECIYEATEDPLFQDSPDLPPSPEADQFEVEEHEGARRPGRRAPLRRKKASTSNSDSDSDYEPEVRKKRKRGRPSSSSTATAAAAATPERKYDPSKVIMASTQKRIVFTGRYKHVVIDRKKSRFPCDFCKSKIIYQSPHGYKRHILAHMDSDKINNLFDCTKCGHPNLSEDTLRRHLSKYHEVKQNTCSICGHASSRRWLHDKHMLKEHNIKNWTPIKVPEELKDKVLTIRKEGEEDEPPIMRGPKTYNCEQCESVYVTRTGMRKHLRIHKESNAMGRKFDCKLCHHPNNSDRSLKLHMSNYHGEANQMEDVLRKTKIEDVETAKPSEATEGPEILVADIITRDEFHCKKCPSVLPTLLAFQKHQRLHRGSKYLGHRFDCSQCKYPTTSPRHLQKHLFEAHGIGQVEEEVPPPPPLQSEAEDGTPSQPATSASPSPSQPDRERPRRSSKMPSKYADISSDSASEAEDQSGHGEDEDWSPPPDGDGGPEVEPESEGGEGAEEGDDGDSDFDVDEASNQSRSESKDYICKLCVPNVAYRSSRGYRRHQEEHKASIALKHKYDCDKCGYPTSCESKLRYHKKRVHQISTLLSCKFCTFQARKPSQLKRHMIKHASGYQRKKIGRKPKLKPNNEPYEDFECNQCTATYKSAATLKRHMREHVKSKRINNEFSCEECNFPCLDEKSLERHKLRTHQEKNVRCHLCDKIFIRGYMLRAHLNVHKRYDKLKDDTGYYQCPMCPYKGSMQGFVLHKNHKHVGLKLDDDDGAEELLCNLCGLSFTTNVNLNIHIRNKHEKRFRNTCEICGKGFESTVAFKAHVKTHDKNRIREFVCSFCGTQYSHKKTLDDHIARFHPEHFTQPRSSLAVRAEKPGKFKCKWCDMVFPFKYLLVNHMPSAHKDLYNFICNVCNKSYISASSLRLHQEITHSDGLNEFSCEYCGKVFKHKHYVICHYKYCTIKKTGAAPMAPSQPGGGQQPEAIPPSADENRGEGSSKAPSASAIGIDPISTASNHPDVKSEEYRGHRTEASEANAQHHVNLNSANLSHTVGYNQQQPYFNVFK